MLLFRCCHWGVVVVSSFCRLRFLCRLFGRILRVVFSVGRLKMLGDDYRVDIYSPNLGRFVSENRDYTFFSALDEDVTLSDE